MSYIKSNFELQKQILIDLVNLNATLGLMNESKLFPSKAVRDSVNSFCEDRRNFVKRSRSTGENKNGKRKT